MFYFYDSENSFSSLRLYLDACQCDDSIALFTFAFHYVVAIISATLAHVYLFDISNNGFIYDTAIPKMRVSFLIVEIIYGCDAVIVIHRHLNCLKLVLLSVVHTSVYFYRSHHK